MKAVVRKTAHPLQSLRHLMNTVSASSKSVMQSTFPDFCLISSEAYVKDDATVDMYVPSESTSDVRDIAAADSRPAEFASDSTEQGRDVH